MPAFVAVWERAKEYVHDAESRCEQIVAWSIADASGANADSWSLEVTRTEYRRERGL